eukprot:30395-Pelagococcus_subviridis.AAC.3
MSAGAARHAPTRPFATASCSSPHFLSASTRSSPASPLSFPSSLPLSGRSKPSACRFAAALFFTSAHSVMLPHWMIVLLFLCVCIASKTTRSVRPVVTSASALISFAVFALNASIETSASEPATNALSVPSRSIATVTAPTPPRALTSFGSVVMISASASSAGAHDDANGARSSRKTFTQALIASLTVFLLGAAFHVSTFFVMSAASSPASSEEFSLDASSPGSFFAAVSVSVFAFAARSAAASSPADAASALFAFGGGVSSSPADAASTRSAWSRSGVFASSRSRAAARSLGPFHTKRTSGWMGGETRRAKSLRNGVHHTDAVVWEPVYRTRLRRRLVVALALVADRRSLPPGAGGSLLSRRLRLRAPRAGAIASDPVAQRRELAVERHRRVLQQKRPHLGPRAVAHQHVLYRLVPLRDRQRASHERPRVVRGERPKLRALALERVGHRAEEDGDEPGRDDGDLRGRLAEIGVRPQRRRGRDGHLKRVRAPRSHGQRVGDVPEPHLALEPRPRRIVPKQRVQDADARDGDGFLLIVQLERVDRRARTAVDEDEVRLGPAREASERVDRALRHVDVVLFPEPPERARGVRRRRRE